MATVCRSHLFRGPLTMDVRGDFELELELERVSVSVFARYDYG